MKMTVREALEHIQKADGMVYTDELFNKLTNFLRKLPRNPMHDNYNMFEIADYSEGWYVGVRIDHNKYYIADNDEVLEGEDTFKVTIFEGGAILPSDTLVKSNEEALEVLKEIDSIKFANDIDANWNMSDDYSYWRKMSDLDDKALSDRRLLISKLQYLGGR